MPMRHSETARSACAYYALHACVCVSFCPLAAEPRDRVRAKPIVNRKEREREIILTEMIFLFSWLIVAEACGGVLALSLSCGGIAPVRSIEVRMICFIAVRR